MKHSAAKLIGVVGLLVASTATGTSFAAPPPSGPSAPRGQQQGPSTPGGQQQGSNAPNTCQDIGGEKTTASDTTSPIATGDPYGPVALVVDALSKVCLTADQRGAIEQLGREVRPKEEAVANARHALLTTLAEDVRSDNFDDAALKSKVEDLVKARKEASPVLRKALEDLHGILDAGQRTQFVDAIDARTEQMKSHSKAWHDQLSKDLALSDDQKARIKDVLDTTKSDLESDRDRMKAVFDAFKGDQFKVEQIAPESDVETRVRARAEAMVRSAREIAAILTADQRSKLADKIESKAEGKASGENPSGGTQGMGSHGAALDKVQQGQFVGGYGMGSISGWGYSRGYSTYQSSGYVGGYPFVGGWGPGIW